MILQPLFSCKQNFICRHFRHFTVWELLFPDRFAIDLDEWKDGDAHDVSVFAMFPAERPSGFDSVLLAIAPMVDVNFLSAKEPTKYSNLSCQPMISLLRTSWLSLKIQAIQVGRLRDAWGQFLLAGTCTASILPSKTS